MCELVAACVRALGRERQLTRQQEATHNQRVLVLGHKIAGPEEGGHAGGDTRVLRRQFHCCCPSVFAGERSEAIDNRELSATRDLRRSDVERNDARRVVGTPKVVAVAAVCNKVTVGGHRSQSNDLTRNVCVGTSVFLFDWASPGAA